MIGKDDSEAFDEASRYFELGRKYQLSYQTTKAIEYYTSGIGLCQNPSLYINRADILKNRLRYHEALQDLIIACRLDEGMANEFQQLIQDAMSHCEYMSRYYRDGTRKKLLEELELTDKRHMAGRLYTQAFKMHLEAWVAGWVAPPFSEYYVFFELDRIRKNEDLEVYQWAQGYLASYPAEFVEAKVENCPNNEEFSRGIVVLRSALCCFNERTVSDLRYYIFSRLHDHIIQHDYPGEISGSLSCPSITREAWEFVYGEEYRDDED